MNATDIMGNNPFIGACIYNNVNNVKILVERVSRLGS